MSTVYLTLVKNTCNKIPLLQNCSEFPACVRPRPRPRCRGAHAAPPPWGLWPEAQQNLNTLLQLTVGSLPQLQELGWGWGVHRG